MLHQGKAAGRAFALLGFEEAALIIERAPTSSGNAGLPLATKAPRSGVAAVTPDGSAAVAAEGGVVAAVTGSGAGASTAARRNPYGPCFNCYEHGHIQKDCPKPRRQRGPPRGAQAPAPGSAPAPAPASVSASTKAPAPASGNGQ
jgi:DNA polymerase-3 subunit gamma/tau